MDKVIILKGSSNRGKTHSLRYLIDFLINNHNAYIIYDDGNYSDANSDCFVILDVPKFEKVGIITFGDTGFETKVELAIRKSLEENCFALVAASHSQYKTSEKDGKAVDSVYKILWDFGEEQNAKTVETTTIVKYDEWGQNLEKTEVDILNQICANTLSQLLFKL